jgi:hypothetical protein
MHANRMVRPLLALLSKDHLLCITREVHLPHVEERASSSHQPQQVPIQAVDGCENACLAPTGWGPPELHNRVLLPQFLVHVTPSGAPVCSH